MSTNVFVRAANRMSRAAADRVETNRRCTVGAEPLEARWLFAGDASADVAVHWNELTLQSAASQPPRVPLTRNLALVHAAIFDAVNAIDRSYEQYHAQVHASHGASQEAAAAQAAHDTLTALYPSRSAQYDAALAEDLAGIPPGRARQGVAIGQAVARQILQLRANDGSADIESYTPPNNNPGQWQPTPPDFTTATSAHFPSITPFAIESSTQFQPPPPPALASAEYATAFNETKAIGKDNSATRTADQTQVGLLWRVPLTNQAFWNRVTQDLVQRQDTSLVDASRAFALMNMAVQDALTNSFGSKFHYGLWRPITAIQRADEDGNPATEADPTWMSLHPSTPPYPSYAGNAATIGASAATVLADVFGSAVPFEVHWDAYGFPGVTRSYPGFWAAADEEADSRIYGGIHFRFDSVAGQGIGRGVGNYVVDNYLEPSRHGNGKQEAAGRSGAGALAAPGAVIPTLFKGRNLFSNGSVTRDTLGGETPTVAGRSWLESV